MHQCNITKSEYWVPNTIAYWHTRFPFHTSHNQMWSIPQQAQTLLELNNRKLSETLCKCFTRAFSFQRIVFRTEPVSPWQEVCIDGIAKNSYCDPDVTTDLGNGAVTGLRGDF